MDADYQITLELIKRYVRLLDLVIDAVMSVPARPGTVLDADIRRLRFAAAALGIEMSSDLNETAGKIVGEALRRIEELRPAVELFLTHPTEMHTYGPKSENPSKNNYKTGKEVS